MAFGDLTTLAGVKAWLKTADPTFHASEDAIWAITRLAQAYVQFQNSPTKTLDFREMLGARGMQEVIAAIKGGPEEPQHFPSDARARARARGHQLGEHMDRHARAAKHRIPAHDLAYQPILGRRSGRAD